MSKIKTECGRDIIKIKKEIKKREQDHQKDLFAQKRHYDESIITEWNLFIGTMLQC